MTCIVSFKAGDKTVIAGDFMASDYMHHFLNTAPKVFVKNEFIAVGYTSSFTLGQILEHRWVVPPKLEGQSDDNYIYVTLLDSIRTALDSFKYNIKDCGLRFIFTYKDRIFEVQGDLSILERTNKVAACGSGADIAEGIIHYVNATEGLEKVDINKFVSYIFACVNAVTKTVSSEHTYIILGGDGGLDEDSMDSIDIGVLDLVNTVTGVEWTPSALNYLSERLSEELVNDAENDTGVVDE